MVFNSKTIHYYELLNDLRLCIEDNKNVTHETAYTKQICQNCKVTFEKVNHFYDEIHQKFDKQVCYDLVDSVINFICCVINRFFSIKNYYYSKQIASVRSMWRQSFQCYTPSTWNLTITVLPVVLLLLLLPVVLYLGAKIFCLAKNKHLIPRKYFPYRRLHH